MRRMILPLVSVATLALAACSSSSDASKSGDGGNAPKAPTAVTGSVALRDTSVTVSPAAKLDIKLVDVSSQGAQPLATKTVQPVTFPVQFQLDFNNADVVPNDIYVVQATLTDGDRTFNMPLQAPVLTRGASTKVDIQLAALATPGEKELAGFKDAQKRIGALKVTNGTQLAEGVSRGWQVFRKGNDVVFIRELVDYGDKGFTSTDYSYRNGKPWVIEQQKKPSKDGKATSTERAGWNDKDELVLKQSEAGGKTDALSDDEAASLRKQSDAIFAKGKGGK
jgi:putative lipoprotein